MGVPALPRPSLGRGVFSFLSSEHNHRHLHKHHGPNAQGRSAIWPAIKRNDTVDDIMMLSAMHTTKSPTLTNMKAPRFAKGFQSNTLACRPAQRHDPDTTQEGGNESDSGRCRSRVWFSRRGMQRGRCGKGGFGTLEACQRGRCGVRGARTHYGVELGWAWA